MIDKKAMELIRKSYRKTITEEEKAYCREKGLLIAHEPVTHSKAIMQIHDLSTKFSLETAARSFLYSISSGDRRYRTILSSLIWAKRLTAHYLNRETRSYLSPGCTICGMALSRYNDKTDLPMLEYAYQSLFPTRRNMDICCAGYVLHDLLQFMNLPAADFVEEDLRILRRILGLAEEISTTNKVNALLNLISAETSLSLTVTDAYSILGVLSSCGVFDTPELKSYASGFVRCDDRQFVYETDNYYPLHLWRGKYGINYSAIDDFFGTITGAKISSESSLRGSVVREERDLSSGSPKSEAFFKDDEHLIDLDNSQRYFYGLSPLDPAWDRVVMYSSTYARRKRTEIFFEGDRIRKIIYEFRNTIFKLRSGEFNGYYIESDMDVLTRNRQMILPKTDRGREKTLTPSHLMIPTYKLAQLHVTLGGSHSGISSFNSSNDQRLPVPDSPAMTRDDFTRITEDYIAACPPDYQRDLDRFILNKRVRVRYTAGDIFRVQTSMNQYTYCLILGKIRQLEKWPEVPKGHPIQLMMTQPVIYRQYDILTSNPDMTTEELSSIPLLDIYGR